MKRPYLVLHGFIALLWIGCSLGIGLKIALLGNEGAQLGKRRGADFNTRKALIYEQERQRVLFEQEACVPALEQLVRTLDLPIQPPNANSALARSF